MGGVAKQFSNAELKALATYIASLDGTSRTCRNRVFAERATWRNRPASAGFFSLIRLPGAKRG
jgi:hypothetical protein